jgi:hypothetical protein
VYVKPGAVTWTAVDAKDNAVAAATKLADGLGRRHRISGVLASFSKPVQDKLLRVKDGSTVIAEMYVTNWVAAQFVQPLQASSSNAVSAELDASGAAGTVGTVTLIGYTD